MAYGMRHRGRCAVCEQQCRILARYTDNSHAAAFAHVGGFHSPTYHGAVETADLTYIPSVSGALFHFIHGCIAPISTSEKMEILKVTAHGQGRRSHIAHVGIACVDCVYHHAALLSTREPYALHTDSGLALLLWDALRHSLFA